MSDYPTPPKRDDQPNASFGGFTEAPLIDAEIEELKNRDTRDPEDIATDDERNRCLRIVRSCLNPKEEFLNSWLEFIIKEIESGAKTPTQTRD